MSAGFTSGPWAIAPETNGTELVAYSTDPWRVRAVIVRGDFPDNRIANTNLIVAAPFLYEALQAAMAVMFWPQGCTADERTEAWDKAKAALAKARGEV